MDIFKNMDSKKRERIINSSLDEFSKNSFKKASTNNIVKNAGISKGLLYHYFISKKELYEWLKVFVFEMMINTILEKLDWEESDIFERIKQIVLIKMRVIEQYPSLVTFSKVIYENKSMEEIKELVESISPELYYEVYNRNIDFSRFKEGIDAQKGINIIQWTIEKYSEEQYNKFKMMNEDIDYEEIIKGMDEYLVILKESFYK
jgi:AcrR family transcriptional regulator